MWAVQWGCAKATKMALRHYDDLAAHFLIWAIDCYHPFAVEYASSIVGFLSNPDYLRFCGGSSTVSCILNKNLEARIIRDAWVSCCYGAEHVWQMLQSSPRRWILALEDSEINSICNGLARNQEPYDSCPSIQNRFWDEMLGRGNLDPDFPIEDLIICKSGGIGNPPQSNNAGWIYLMRSQGYIKVGKTKDPKLRLATHQIGNPLPIRMLKKFKTNDMNATERKLKHLLSDWRIRGEWFDIPSELLNRLVSATSIEAFFQGNI